MNVVEINSPPAFSPGLWRSERDQTPWIGAPTSATRINTEQLPEILPDTHEFALSIEVPTFGARLTGEIVELQSSDNYSEITFKSIIGMGVAALLTIRSEPSTGPNENLKIKEASLSFQVSEHRAQPLFIADTLYSMLGLGGTVRVLIPPVNIDMTLRFNIPLSDLSELLQRRKMYFGLMVIEKATDKEFEVPEFISGENMSAIFFAAHAILDRKFIWRVNQIVLPTPANEETFAWYQSLPPSEPGIRIFKLRFGPTDASQTILGQEISLGSRMVFLDDAVIEDYENVGAALALKDERIVTVRIRPLSRVGRYVFPDAPTLLNNAWDHNVRQFIEQDGHLSQALITRYLTLMSIVVPERPPEQMFALINPETIAVLAEQAHARQTPVDEFLASLLKQDLQQTTPDQTTEEQFHSDMVAFAEGTENLLPYSGSYSRSDIYFDHD
ncbi:MAG TPA: hypothetical protein VF290_12090 [Pyrinomonadaceae bacterium]